MVPVRAGWPAPRARWRIAAVAAVLTLVVVAIRSDPGRGGSPVADDAGPIPATRDLGPYRGLGTWVDAFDYGPAYQTGGHAPPVTPGDVDAMADAGVKTVFIQANRDDPRSPDGFVDQGLLAQFVRRAHDRGVAVVGWYLPTFTDVDTDLGHLQDLLDFTADGHRLDGVAVDIEYTEAVPDPGLRNRRLLRLSERLDAMADGEPIGAIVLPAVLTEVVNPALWPDFPWADLEPLYDVWLPMTYWTLRTEVSGYQDGATYLEESTRRMVADLGTEDVVVHGIGGIGDETTGEDLVAFIDTLVATGAVGGSVYDWATLSELNRQLLDRLFVGRPGLT